MGGRSITLKNVPSRTVQGMKFPGAPYGLKMACGENPKRDYGNKGRAPSNRMGNFAVNRATWAIAAAYTKKMDDGKAVDRDQIGRAQSELQSLMPNSYTVFSLKKHNTTKK